MAKALGHTYVKATFYNPLEYVEYSQGKRELESDKRVDLEALVDTGATFPALPEDKVEALPEDRTAGSYVMVRPKGTTPLIGVVALEQMGYNDATSREIYAQISGLRATICKSCIPTSC